MTPFPTVTPDYLVYETKPVFLSYGGYGGDGGSETDEYYGRGTPWLIIYGDGQLLIRDGVYRESITFLETTLTPAEMCTLRQQIDATGFTQPHSQFYTDREESMGGGNLVIQVENTFYSFYSGDVQYLVDDLANGVQVIQNYRPADQLIPYSPTFLVLWIEEVEPNDQVTPAVWPSEMPTLAELWTNRDQNTVFIEGEWVIPIFDLFSRQLIHKIFQEGDDLYRIIARPILPHETPRHIGYYPTLPRDYVPVLDCENEPALIPSTLPTATPTLTSPVARLTGQGRILFVSGTYSNQEIFVSEANGTNRLRLTNNLFADNEPVWSPDGQHIAFVSERSGNLDIFVMDADGSHVRQLTDDSFDDYSPTWSPDGIKIAFISDRDGGWQESEIYVMAADGSQQERLTQNATRDLYPVWSPDGRKIAFVKELAFNSSSVLTILYLDEVEAVEEQMSFRGRILPRPAWSPDSSRLAIFKTPDIHILNLDDSETHTITLLPLEHADSFDWSADGRFLLFAARQPNGGENAVHYSEDQSYYGNWGIYALDLAAEEVIQITFTEQDESSPAWWP